MAFTDSGRDVSKGDFIDLPRGASTTSRTQARKRWSRRVQQLSLTATIVRRRTCEAPATPALGRYDGFMGAILHPWQLLVVGLAGWINRQQLDVIDYLREENRVLREQMRYVIDQYVEHYHSERNHQGLGNRLIEPPTGQTAEGTPERRERLGGMLNFYHRQAA